jgi:hypothetical protein
MKKRLAEMYSMLLEYILRVIMYLQYGRKMRKFKNTKCGQRCFIIGNGPSLNIKDLEKLKGEDTFATNRIYNLFGKTSWRPTYYCIQDFVLLNQIKEKLNYVVEQSQFCFFSSNEWKTCNKQVKRNKKLNLFYLDTEAFYPNLPKFSNKIDFKIFEGFTVTYVAIQIAVYMGYSDIYIIGVDHNYSIDKKPDGNTIVSKNVNNYAEGIQEIDFNIFNLPQLDKSALAYVSARKYCEERGINIWNATRGGKLEVFERVDFDLVIRG